jgi:hypothetical protein
MKLTKKQLSASYVMQATASKSLKEQAYPGGYTKGDVANHRDSRLDCSSVASLPRQGRVHHTSQLRKTSGDKAMESIAGPENQPGVAITPLQLYVEEGPQSVKYRDTCYGNGKA